MKKYIVLAAMLLAGCDTLSALQSSEMSQLNACMLSEAQTRLTSGTLFASGIKAAATDLSQTCIKKLALQKAGLDDTALSSATSIINSLKAAQ
ncbi:MAG: hypothetical protein IJ184_00690 [Alphaproteobacteria bacterium]|nr:hypothetical protein [Alphaproteobacteria bacterium]